MLYLIPSIDTNVNEERNMICISRTDDEDKNLFVDKNRNRKGRWNLYSQIAIENDVLRCGKETYSLTSVCNDLVGTQPCTLLDTNEVVDIGSDHYG